MGGACCTKKEQDEKNVSGEEPSLKVDSDEEEEKDEAENSTQGTEDRTEAEEESLWELPPGNPLTVMMFGMTGSGKSSIGNLLAGSHVFAAGDDTASITNLDSCMKWEAEDSSLTLLDTIGLGDTEIDQDKVVTSIRDSALSAINGVDILLYVMRNTRITDDAITRLIYVTEYLWGHECMLNLYIVVTCANKYMNSRADANEWVKRQVEINWRFKHIYSIVGNNPNRFIFVDNPDPDSGEPGLEERRKTSLEGLMKTFVLHPREVVPAYTHATMKRAQEMTQAERLDLQAKEMEVQHIQKQLDAIKPKKAKAKKKAGAKKGRRPSKDSSGGRRPSIESSASESKKGAAASLMENVTRLVKQTSAEAVETEKLEQNLKQAKKDKMEAQKAMMAKINSIKKDTDFRLEASRQAEMASVRYQEHLESIAAAQGRTKSGDDTQKAKVNAGRGLLAMLSRKFKGGSKEMVTKKAAPAPTWVSAEDAQAALPQYILAIKAKMEMTPAEQFRKLGGWKGTGAITPMVFTKFLRSHVEITALHVGALWRLGDSNCDGQIDLQEFRALFGEMSAF